MLRFTARIEIVGVNPYVQVPARVTRHFGQRGYVPVNVHLESGHVPSTLVPIGGGVHRLYINGKMLKCTKARVGDRVSLGLELDPSDRRLETPDYLVAALSPRPRAKARWEALTPSRRKEVLRYLSVIKTDATRTRNVARLLKILESESGDGSLSGIRIEDRRNSD